MTVLWLKSGYTIKYCLSPRDFPWVQAIFHRIPRLESQYSHSQLPLLDNIFWCWLRELAIFSRIGSVSLQYFLVLAPWACNTSRIGSVSLQYFLVLASWAGPIRIRKLLREYTDSYWTSSTWQIFSCIANLRSLVWQLQKFTRKYTLCRREYCNSYFSVFHH